MMKELLDYTVFPTKAMRLGTTDDTLSLNVTCPSIDDFRNQVYSTAYSIITVLGLAGNGFALLVLLWTSQQRSAFYNYMLNLAVSDLLCVSMLPLRVDYYFNKGQWNHGDFLCRISSYSLYVNLYCSIFFMTGISFIRFLAIVFPVQNLSLVFERKTYIFCIAIWVFTCATCSPVLMQGEYFDEETNKTKCYEPPEDRKGLHLKLSLSYFSFVIGFIIPFLMIMFFYVAIVKVLLLGRPNQTQVKRRASCVKAIRMIAIITTTFLVSFMPYHIQRTRHLHLLSRRDAPCDQIIPMQKSVVVTLCLAASNCCFDPLLYFFSGENFRERLSTIRSHSSVSQSDLPKVAQLNMLQQCMCEGDQPD